MLWRRHAKRRRTLACDVMLVALALAGAATSQTNDHLKCYKVKNTTLYQGAVDLLTADGLGLCR